MFQKNNILYYFLISSIRPKKKIFELINTNDKDTYVEAQEILGNYLNTNSLKVERVKIESRDNAFHIYITNKEIVYMSYSNAKLFPSEKNFELFDEINRYLMRKIKERIIGGQSFLIEDEKDEIKEIINSNLEEIYALMSSDGSSIETENEVLQVNNSKEDINNNLKEEEQKGETIEISSRNRQNNVSIKKILRNKSHPSQNELTEKILQDKDNEKDKDRNKKNESSGEEIIKNKNNNSTLPYGKSSKILFNNPLKTELKSFKHKNFSKNTLLSKTSQKNIDGLMREKSKTHLKLSSTKTINKNYSYNKYNINNLNFNRNKTDCCKKEAILVILISIIVLQIAIIPIIINFYDFSI